MDLVQNSSSSTGLGICSSSLGVLSADNNRMPSSGYNNNNGGPLSPNVSMKQCRSTSEMEVDNGDEGGPLKLARKDSFSYSSRPPPSSEQLHTKQLNIMNTNNNSGGPGNNAGGGVPALFRSNSFSAGDGRVTCSPTNSSCLSDGVLLGSDAAANLMGHDARMLRNDPGMSAPGGYAAGGGSRPFSYQSYQYAAAGAGGSPLMLAAAARGDHHLGMQSAMVGMRGPFTASQWAELEHQALIYKYMMAGASVPPELLHPIRRSVALNNLAASHPSLRMGWGNFHLGIPNNPDPEPGRCRRTDGKKWRCSREVVPDQKYCDRHMHRGRNRSKKNAENQAAAANSQAGGGAGAAAAPPSAGNMSVGGGQGSNLNQIHSSLRPPLGMNGQQNQHTSASPYNTNKSYSPHSALPSGIPSNNSASSVQFPLQSLSGASPVANKDYRYMNGMNKADLGLGPEQLLFSDASGSSRGSGQDPHSLMLPSGSWQQNFPSKFPQASQTKFISSSSPPSMYHSAQQLRSLAAGQQFGASEANQMSIHQPLLSSNYGGMDVGRESEEQPLRHFFDDWPRQRDPSTLSWPDMEDEKQSRTSATQLSISSSDFRVTPPRGKLSLSPLKLSMSRSEEEEQLGGGDPTRMGLGVGLGINHHRQHPWMHNLEGGPLAEVLQSSTPRDCSKSSPGLNLLGDGWESSSRENSRMASPTGVLSKTPFACFSDSSSNASSPRAVHAEAALLANGSKQLTS